MADFSQNNKRLARNTAFLYVRMLFVMFVALFTTRIVLQALGVVDYGIYNIVAGFVSLFSVLNNCLTTGANRFYNYAIGKNDNEGVTRVFNASIKIQLIFLVVLVLLVEFVGLWYINNKMLIPEDRLSAAIILFHSSICSLIFLILQIPFSSAVMAYEKMNFYAIISVIDAIGKLIIAYLIKETSTDKLVLYGWLLTLISIINFILYFSYSIRHFPALKYSKELDKRLFKSLLTFSSWSMLDPFSYIVRDQGSNMTLNLFFGPIVNAAYGIATQVSGAVSGFASNLSIAFRPQVIQSYSSGNHVRTKKLMISMSKINFILQMVIALPLIFEMDYILKLWLGEAIPQYTSIFAILVLVINSVNTLNEPVSIIMVATGRIKKIKIYSMFIICSVVPLGYLFFNLGMPPYFIYLIMFSLTIINQIGCVLIMYKEFPVISPKDYLKEVVVPCLILTISSLIVPVTITQFLSSSFLRLFVVFACSCFSTSIFAYMICLRKNERSFALSYINKLIYNKR